MSTVVYVQAGFGVRAIGWDLPARLLCEERINDIENLRLLPAGQLADGLERLGLGLG